MNGDVAWNSDTPDSTGTALSFDGNGDWVNIPDDASLQLVDELTLSAWVKESVPHTYAKIIPRRSGSYYYFLGVDNGRPSRGNRVHWVCCVHLSMKIYDNFYNCDWFSSINRNCHVD